ncbi:S-layer protein [Xylophilus rhododendri]|uniref:S-layer protein n=1 Tax=Xylophilus rhododendri TaxID=2697032 RepID=A0A857JCG3_9BURK|nr:S-layer protein [Xylophilus rhododendri]
MLCNLLFGSLLLAGCGGSNDPIVVSDAKPVTPVVPVVVPPTVVPPVVVSNERWTVGDLHVHTFQSDDTQQTTTLDQVLAKAFTTYGLDWAAISDHLRVSNYDNNGNRLPAAIPFSKGMADYQVPRIKALQAAGTYADKTIFAAFEWDMPTHDHANIGILTDTPMSAAALKAANQFEYLFTNRAASDFLPADVAAWNAADTKAFSTHADAMAAIAWLKKNYPETSYMQINHPSRNLGSYTIAQLREMNDLAPRIMFSIEGMVGNQMEPDRGGYTQASATTPNPVALTYGGVDYLVATLGGTWDALLSEGRHIWNVADSDYHFKTNGANSSGYSPGEYAKNHLWGEIKDPKSLLAAMRGGKVYGTYGDLISALDFRVTSSAGTGEMGSDMTAKLNETLTVTVRFKSPDRNNYEFQVGSGVPANLKPQVDHIDIIAGNITGLEVAGTAGYSRATNPSTRVVKRLTASDWKLDADGYYAASYTMPATTSTYFRLRGTNQGVNVAGETSNGEPLADVSIKASVVTDAATRFNAINARNYSDLWFYSNPVFVKVGGA